MSVKLEVVQVENPKELNLIFGQSHFIKTVEDLYEQLIQSAMGIKFGIAFCEASGECKIRTAGNDADLEALACKNAQLIGCGHSFIIFIDNAFPINILQGLRNVAEIVTLYAATANPLQVIVAVTEQGRGVMGVVDGFAPKGVENAEDKEARMALLRRFGYKLH